MGCAPTRQFFKFNGTNTNNVNEEKDDNDSIVDFLANVKMADPMDTVHRESISSTTRDSITGICRQFLARKRASITISMYFTCTVVQIVFVR